MKIEAIGICALGLLMAVGCDRLEQVVDLGHKAQEETKRERDRQQQEVADRQTSLQAERDSLNALISGKLAVLSNRVSEAESAIRALQADRAAFSKELGNAMQGKGDVNGVGLERALSSPVVNSLAMKYLHMDFSVTRGEYAEAIAKARKCESELKLAIAKQDRGFERSIDTNPQREPAARLSRQIDDLRREHDQLERRRSRLTRITVSPGNMDAKEEHDREVRDIENRMREIKHQIDQLRRGDERVRQNADRIAERARKTALEERDRAVKKLKEDFEKKADVLKTVQIYNEKTLRRLERAFVDEATALDEKLRKSHEGYLTLKGIGASVPKLSVDGLRKLQGQVIAL